MNTARTHFSLIRRTATAGVVLSLLALALPVARAQREVLPAPQAASETTRSATRDDPRTGGAYAHQWAVIVGVNYRPADRQAISAKGTVAPLENAEADARAFADLLKKGYRYKEEELFLFLGKDATKKNIEKTLREGLFTSGKVGANDSVLFYFAGHGHVTHLADGKVARGYLLPVDADAEARNTDTATAIDVRSHADYLAQRCPARHKLLVLDCCHAGSIFLDGFNIRHGLAMAERFQGRPEEAVGQYRRLTREIDARIRRLDTERRDDMENYGEVRALLFDRLVNSLERQGDCHLFAPTPDPAEAADDYRRAEAHCDKIPSQRVDEVRAKLLYKRSLALSLGNRDGDPELAARLLTRGDEVYDDIESPSQALTFLSVLAETVAGAARDACDATFLGRLRRAIVKYRGHFDTAVTRDDLEALMFAGRILLERERAAFDAKAPEARFQLAEDADLLLGFCRLAHQAGEPRPETLTYLRPYYDAAFAAKAALGPRHLKELIEAAWEATRGTAHQKPERPGPLLVLHYAAGRGYLLLDTPGGDVEMHLLGEDISAEYLGRASAGEPLPLPTKLRRALADGDVTVRWHDPVHGLGYSTVSRSASGLLAASRGKDFVPASAPRPLTEAVFPFQLPRKPRVDVPSAAAE